jgi:hypothetical protein
MSTSKNVPLIFSCWQNQLLLITKFNLKSLTSHKATKNVAMLTRSGEMGLSFGNWNWNRISVVEGLGDVVLVKR